MNIGKAIQRLRKAAALNQTEFAEKVGLTQASISHIENGYKNPHQKNLLKICKALEIPLFVLQMLALEPDDYPESKRHISENPVYLNLQDMLIKLFI